MTTLLSPEVFRVDFRGNESVFKLVHTFSNVISYTGITKPGVDTFYNIAGNFSLSTLNAVPACYPMAMAMAS